MIVFQNWLNRMKEKNMKDSNIFYIGEIPSKWENWRLQDAIIQLPKSNIQASEGNEEGEYPFYTSSQILNKRIDKCLYKGDAITMATGGFASVNYSREDFSTSTDCFNFKSNQDTRFIYYWLFSIKDSIINDLWFEGMGLKHLQKDDLLKSHIFFPSISQQNKICNYLDIKCMNIDSLIINIERQIDILKEYKKSLITETVTKGMNSNIELKESSIEWIGKYPKKWKLIKLKYASLIKGRIGWQGLRTDEYHYEDNLPYLITGTDFDNGVINWKTCAHVTEERFKLDKNIQINENDLLITKDGTIGKIAIVKNCPEKVCLNSGVFIIRNTKKYKYFDKYLYYILQSNQFTQWYDFSNAGNSTIKHLNQDNFYNFVFTYPEIAEQKEIANYLDTKCYEIDSIITDKTRQLDLLDKYKKSLIYEYVTGKKEVL